MSYPTLSRKAAGAFIALGITVTVILFVIVTLLRLSLYATP